MSDSVSLDISFPYWTAYKATLQVLIRSPLQILLSAVFPVLGLYLVYLWVTHHHHMTPYDFILLFVCFFFTPITTAISLYLVRRRNPLTIGPFKYVFDASGIHASGAAFETTIRWQAIRKVVETRSFVLIFVAPTRAISIPVAQLQAAGIVEALRNIIHTNMPSTLKQ